MQSPVNKAFAMIFDPS